MPNNVGVIPEFFFPDNSIPTLTKEFLENVPQNSRIIIYKGQLRKDCYVVVEDCNTRRTRAFSDEHTFNECIAELESVDMTLEEPIVSSKKVNDALRKLWNKVKEDMV